MYLFAVKTPIFKQDNDVFVFLRDSFSEQQITPKEKSVVIIASKIIALSQGRIVQATKKEMEKWVQKESQEYWATQYPGVFLALKENILIANAGIDASNAEDGTLILWPENVQEVAGDLCEKMKEEYNLSEVGVLISDSRCTPLRTGVTGVALAWSGFEGVRNEIGTTDIYGKALEVTQNAIADNLASAAELVMGNAGEKTPIVVCENAPVTFTVQQQNPKTAVFPKDEDLFSVFWQEVR